MSDWWSIPIGIVTGLAIQYSTASLPWMPKPATDSIEDRIKARMSYSARPSSVRLDRDILAHLEQLRVCAEQSISAKH